MTAHPPSTSFGYADTAIPIVGSDTVLTALYRRGIHPNDGGALCFGGDCGNCVATVNDVPYVRTCQTAAADVTTVIPHPAGAPPPLPTQPGESTGARFRSVDVVVIGAGTSGSSAAAAAAIEGTVAIFDASRGEEVVGIYPGPRVVVRTRDAMLTVDCDEVVVATGAAEIQPICEGSDLAGILTLRAARHLEGNGIDLGDVVIIGDPPGNDIDGQYVSGTLLRFEGIGTVEAVVVETSPGEERHPCTTVVTNLGLYPRDTLARMGAGLPVTVVGSAAATHPLPTLPAAGVVCPCNNVTIGQLDAVWDRGFQEMELAKRATLAGTGTCQGGVCLPYLHAFLEDRGGSRQSSFTARPVARQVTLAEMGAGSHLPAYPRTALDGVHRQLGAHMDRIGGWWRPWTYGDTAAEYHAVRTGVSICDVSTLGTMTLSGPDAAATIQQLYPTDISTLRPGRSRYALMLNERGYVFDDGLIARNHDDTYTLTFTTGGASHAEMWIRDWTASWGHDTTMMNTTFSYGAINVTGPTARDLLARAGAAPDLLPGYMRHTEITVAGIPCTVFRLGFTGELSYELHHDVAHSVELWEALLDLGGDFGAIPHGIEALTWLRLEKGHILIGQDTDLDATPARIDHTEFIKMDKNDFIGKRALLRTQNIPLDRQLIGLKVDGTPLDGSVIWHNERYVGYVTSGMWSPTLNHGVALGWVDVIDGALPDSFTINGAAAERMDPPFYDPTGSRTRA